MDLPLNVDFTGKVVVITGAGGVICSTMARAFAQAGAKVAAINRTGIKAEKLAEKMRGEGIYIGAEPDNQILLNPLMVAPSQVKTVCDALMRCMQQIKEED